MLSALWTHVSRPREKSKSPNSSGNHLQAKPSQLLHARVHRIFIFIFIWARPSSCYNFHVVYSWCQKLFVDRRHDEKGSNVLYHPEPFESLESIVFWTIVLCGAEAGVNFDHLSGPMPLHQPFSSFFRLFMLRQCETCVKNRELEIKPALLSHFLQLHIIVSWFRPLTIFFTHTTWRWK